MHLYVLARGNKDKLDRWVNDILAQYLPFEYEKGKPKGLLQVSVRPIQLYEIVFPEEHLETVLGMVRPYGCKFSKRIQRLAGVFRKVMGLDKIPEKEARCNNRVISPFVNVVGLGTKKDAYKKGIEQI